MTGDVSIGVPGALGPDAVRRLAPRLEAAGFAGLWLNDSPEGDSLAGLAAAAEVTEHLRLASGVIPVDRRPAPEIIASIDRTGVPEARLTLGIGSGAIRQHPVDRVREELAALRDGTAAAVAIGALGPRMRALAAESDGALLSWLTPAAATEQAAAIREAGRRSGGPVPRVALYTRTIVDERARDALEAEAAGYAGYPAYARHFERLGVRAIDTTLSGDVAGGVAAYREAVDELVLRAITPNGTLDELLAFVDRAGELLRLNRAPSAR